MDLRLEHSPTTSQTSPATTAPPPPPSSTTIAIAIMTAQRHPFNVWFPRALGCPHQHGVKVPSQHVFGQPAPLPPPPPKSQLGLPRMADRAFSQYTRRRETIFPNPYREDLYRLNGYCKNVATHTDRASWDFSLAMPRPGNFKTAWTGISPQKTNDMGYDGSFSSEWEDTNDDGNDEPEDETDDEDASASSDDTSINTSESSDSPRRGRSPTLRRCTNAGEDTAKRPRITIRARLEPLQSS